MTMVSDAVLDGDLPENISREILGRVQESIIDATAAGWPTDQSADSPGSGVYLPRPFAQITGGELRLGFVAAMDDARVVLEAMPIPITDFIDAG